MREFGFVTKKAALSTFVQKICPKMVVKLTTSAAARTLVKIGSSSKPNHVKHDQFSDTL